MRTVAAVTLVHLGRIYYVYEKCGGNLKKAKYVKTF